MRRLNILCLSILLFAGIALIAYSLIAQDRELLQDMEEYTALVELVQNGPTDEPDKPNPYPDTAQEDSLAVISGNQDIPTNIPALIAEIVDVVKESADQPVNQAGTEAEQTALPGADQGAIIIVIPGETDEAKRADSSGQTTNDTQGSEEAQQAATIKPAGNNSGNQRADNEQTKTTSQPRPTEKAASSPEITHPAQESPSASPVIETPTPQPVPTATPVPKIGKTGVDLEACKAQNNDFVAWLKIPGTKINYPVVWTDRVDYYLTHTFSGKESKIGTLFSLGKTDYATPGRNIAVYGHHITTSGGNMFQPLMSYKKKSFYENHKTIYFDTLYDLGEYSIFAVINMKSTDWDASAASFGSGQDFLAFVNRAKAASLYDTWIEVNENDHILTLITCDRDYHNPDGRLIVMAVKQ